MRTNVKSIERVGLPWDKTDPLIGSLISEPSRRARQFFADRPRRDGVIYLHLVVHLSTHVVRMPPVVGLKSAIGSLFNVEFQFLGFIRLC